MYNVSCMFLHLISALGFHGVSLSLFGATCCLVFFFVFFLFFCWGLWVERVGGVAVLARYTFSSLFFVLCVQM